MAVRKRIGKSARPPQRGGARGAGRGGARALHGARLRPGLDRGDPRALRGEPGRALPPLPDQARPLPGGLHGQRAAGDRPDRGRGARLVDPVRGDRLPLPGATCGRPSPTRSCVASAWARAGPSSAGRDGGKHASSSGSGSRSRPAHGGDRGGRTATSRSRDDGHGPARDDDRGGDADRRRRGPGRRARSARKRWSSTCSRACVDSIARRCRRRSKSRTRSSSSTATR